MRPGSVDVWVATVLAAVVTLAIVHRRALAAVWFRMEDGRTLAAMRIVTGALLLLYVGGREPLHEYLLTDEGLFPTEVAQQVFAAKGFAGYGWPHEADSPAGFFDLRAVLTWVFSTNHSLLLLRSDPVAVHWHLVAFYVACGAFTVGLFTRVTKWATWFLLMSLLYRNHIAAAGEQVFVCFLVPLCWSRCEAMWSLDRLLERRRAPARLVPAWPRWLMILQTVPMWTANGLSKYGRDWADGDTLWYAIHHPLLRQPAMAGMSDAVGPVSLRLATWFVHGFELAFPLVVIGVVAGAFADAPRLGVRSRAIARSAWVALGVAMIGLAWAGFPVDARGRLPFLAVHVWGAASMLFGTGIVRVPRVLRPWIFARRLWLVAALAFTAPLTVMFDFGPFTTMAAATCLVFLRGEEIGGVVTKIAKSIGIRSHPATAPGAPAPPGLTRRAAIATLCAVHLLAAGLAILPRNAPSGSRRDPIEWASAAWLRFWGTWQAWRMFAPNAPHVVQDLRVEVGLEGGDTLDIGHGFAADGRFDPGPARDKSTKVVGRLAGGGATGWYRKWHARYVCRAWALRHGGQVPQSVTLWRVFTPIPRPPDRVDSRHVVENTANVDEIVHVSVCAHDTEAQPSPEVLRRHGIDLANTPEHRPWVIHRWTTWTDPVPASRP